MAGTYERQFVLTDNKYYHDIADAIRDKGVSGDFKPEEMATAIASIDIDPKGTATAGDVLKGSTFMSAASEDLQTGTLALSGTATAANVLNGKTFYNTNAKTKVTGTLSLSGTAVAGDVLENKTFYNTSTTKVTGTLALSGTATAADVVSGKTFYNTDAKTKVTGTLGYYEGGII